MIDVKLLREEPEKVKAGISKKKADPGLVDRFLELDHEWRKLGHETNELRATQKKLGEERQIEEAKKLKEEIKIKDERLTELEKEREAILKSFPNIPFEDVPVGKDEDENVVIKQVGEPTTFDFEPLDHLVLGERLGIIDTETASQVSGARFSYLKGGAALLEFALTSYVLKTLRDEKVLRSIADSIKPGYSAKPFVPVIPPQMIRPEVFERMGRLEPKEERYYIPGDDLYLIGSAEHTLGPLHMDQVLKEEELPIRYVGFSTSFRREAGSYGKDTRGIIRVHQFDKLEIESFTLPQDSRLEQDFIVALQEHLLKGLGLPYQVMAVCTGDMGAPDARQIDINTWMPGQGKYRETHTSDLMTDYQSRRLNTRFKKGSGELEYVHMNDATAFAMGRIIVAIIENYQKKDGTIEVPPVLRDYCGLEIISS